jgi:hypothetical protein
VKRGPFAPQNHDALTIDQAFMAKFSRMTT